MTSGTARPELLPISLDDLRDSPLKTQRLFHQKGTYLLLLHFIKPRHVTVGRLGRHRFAPGWYAYVGSAFGPGGLRARLGHHFRRSAAPRWHIDYLTRVISPAEAWVTVDPKRWEHPFAQRLHRSPESSTPVPGFGASDCRCRSHLFHFAGKPDLGVTLPATLRLSPG